MRNESAHALPPNYKNPLGSRLSRDRLRRGDEGPSTCDGQTFMEHIDIPSGQLGQGRGEWPKSKHLVTNQEHSRYILFIRDWMADVYGV